MDFSSQSIANAVEALSKFPGIGKKTALRMALYLLRSDQQVTLNLAKSLVSLVEEVGFCKKCHHISEEEYCSICTNLGRDQKTICVVKDFQDVFSIESTAYYKGVYHVLKGLISPLDGMGPENLSLADLFHRVAQDGVEEIILALPATMEGDTTSHYLVNKLKENSSVKVSTISRGISVGGELDYVDELTLARSIIDRRDY
ncbi:MAG: recombination mediator RecR [Bacteroidota bacterium]|nr:recombination mediator RecR [Bacteroidota bacterium]